MGLRRSSTAVLAFENFMVASPKFKDWSILVRWIGDLLLSLNVHSAGLYFKFESADHSWRFYSLYMD